MARKRKRKPQVRANFYSVEKIIYKRRRFQYISNSKGYLYSGASILVKVTKDDLPPYFVPGRFKKCFGYIRTNKVKSLVYLSKDNGHFLKDDVLLISYNDEIIHDNQCGDLFNYQGYDGYIFGLDILTFLKGVKQYSLDIDTSYIENQIIQKKELLKQTNDEVYRNEAEAVDLIQFIGEQI